MESEIIECEILHRPEDPRLGYLPEGPYPIDGNRFSWVSIQHDAQSQIGSLNVFDCRSLTNQSFDLPGRPGFAFVTNRPNQFVIGLERTLGLFDVASQTWQVLAENIDGHTDGTVINDGVAFSAGLIFGCKDLKFQEEKAGLYWYRTADRTLVGLRRDQICSNGKVILRDAEGEQGGVRFLDIDSPKKTVVQYELDLASGTLSAAEIVLDLRAEAVFPDGMIAAPDGGVIISMYDPRDSEYGETRQYDLTTGKCVRRWRSAGSPQVTCPQLIRFGDDIKLVMTTATENMDPAKLALHPNAGCLFVGDTEFKQLPSSPTVEL
jgi:sugar lactone lactonase YvrE